MTSAILLEAATPADMDDVTQSHTPLRPSLTAHSSTSDSEDTNSDALDSDALEYVLESHLSTLMAMKPPALDYIGSKEDINAIITTMPMPEPTKAFIQKSLDRFTSNMDNQRNKVGIITIVRALLPQRPVGMCLQVCSLEPSQEQADMIKQLPLTDTLPHPPLCVGLQFGNAEPSQEQTGMTQQLPLANPSTGSIQFSKALDPTVGPKEGWESAVCLSLAITHLSQMHAFRASIETLLYYQMGLVEILNKAYYPNEPNIYGTPLLPADTAKLTVEDFLRWIDPTIL